MNIKKILLSLSLVAMVLSPGRRANAWAPNNFFRSYDSAITPRASKKVDVTLGVRYEEGQRSTGHTFDGKERNALQLHDERQSALHMLADPLGTAATNSLGVRQLLFTNVPGHNTSIAFLDSRIDIVRNRGFQVLTGNVRERDATAWASAKLFHNKTIGSLGLIVYVPAVFKRVDGVTIQDQTAAETELFVNPPTLTALQATQIKNMVTTQLKDNVKRWGNLDLSDWTRTDIGDVSLLLGWDKKFCTKYKFLRWIGLEVKGGVVFPTAKEKDEDKAFAMPLGNDGAWAFPVSTGLYINFFKHLTLGGNYDVTFYADKTRVRRLKTNVNQTDFLLLNKGSATKAYGNTEQLAAYAHLHRVLMGFGGGFVYQHVSHGHDTLTPKDIGFDKAIVNTTNSLKKWRIDNYIAMLDYDFAYHDRDKDQGKPHRHAHYPYVCAFMKISDHGKNMLDTTTYGGQVTLNF